MKTRKSMIVGLWKSGKYWREIVAAAAIPVCGGADVALAAKVAKVPIWVFHGDSDSVVPVCRSRNMVAALWQCGGNVRYREYPGVNHNCWTPTYADQDVLKWFFEQRRPLLKTGQSTAL